MWAVLVFPFKEQLSRRRVNPPPLQTPPRVQTSHPPTHPPLQCVSAPPPQFLVHNHLGPIVGPLWDDSRRPVHNQEESPHPSPTLQGR